MPGRYVLIPEGHVSLELTPDEWAVALDALERVLGDRMNAYGYTPPNKAALWRTTRKLQEAAEQLRDKSEDKTA